MKVIHSFNFCFSNFFKFAELLSILTSRIYKTEMEKRQSFDTKVSASSQHFILNILFKCLNDKVEPYMVSFLVKQLVLDLKYIFISQKVIVNLNLIGCV